VGFVPLAGVEARACMLAGDLLGTQAGSDSGLRTLK
jgi:hypothetical protein